MIRKLSIGILLVFFALPFGFMLLGSVAGEWRFPSLWPSALTAAHWTQVWSGGHWQGALLRSLALSTVVAALSISAGFLTAAALSKHPNGRFWIRLCYLPYGFSPVIYAYCMQFFYHRSGLAGQWLGVLTAQFVLTYPLTVLLLSPYFDRRLHGMEDLARTLGAGARTVWQKVTLPLLQMPLRVVFFQVFLISWFDYGITAVIGLGQVKTLTLAVYQYIGESNVYLSALAACLVCLAPLLLWGLNQRFIQRFETAI